MKRLVIEFPYERLWRRLFGPNHEQVEILGAISSLKCDFEGLAIICRIRFRNPRVRPSDLVGKGAIRDIETLYEEKDGSLVVFITGKPVVSAPKELLRRDPNRARSGLITARPPEFMDKDRMRVQFLCKDKEAPGVLDFYKRVGLPHRVVGASRLGSAPEADPSRLTPKQRSALLTAYSLGYYDVPRRVGSDQVAKRLGLATSTFAEHLRKAERRVLAVALGFSDGSQGTRSSTAGRFV